MAFARVKQTQLLFQGVYNLSVSQIGSWPSWDIAQCWFGIFYGRFGTALCSHIKRSSTSRGIHQAELNTKIQEGNTPVAAGHYDGSLKLDSSGLCEIW